MVCSLSATADVEQLVIPHINANGLGVVLNEGDSSYTFSFTANSAAVATNIIFYQNDMEVGKLPVAAAQEGANEAVVLRQDIPGALGIPTQWAIELIGDTVKNWGTLFTDSSMIRTSATRVFNAVDKSPESDYFGRIYIMRRAGSSASTERTYNGMYVYASDYTLLTPNLIKGDAEFGNPTRLAVASDGFVYQADWANGYSGIYILDPSDLDGTITQFFAGTRNGQGVFTNNGVAVGSSTPGLGIIGSGKDTKLVVYNEDESGTLPKNGLAIYHIGQPDSTIAHSWGVAPDTTISLTMQTNAEGTPVPTSHGIFVSQCRLSGSNNNAAPSLMFVDYDGTMQMVSCDDPYADIIDGSDGGGYAVSADETMLVLQGGQQQFYVFDIRWQADKPVLTLREEYQHGIQTIRQMNFDFAGNLVCSGESGLTVFTMPTDHNVTVVPAKSALTVCKPLNDAVEGVSLDKDSVELLIGEQDTLVATVTPLNAANKEVVWSSLNDAIASVANGVVTAVADGTTSIIVATVEGNFADTCNVRVSTPYIAVTGVTLDHDSMYFDMGCVGSGETRDLTATVMPADATDQSVTWSSSIAAVASVEDGVVTALEVGETVITVTTNDGGFSATCKVVVEQLNGLYTIAVEGISYSNYTIWNSRGLLLTVYSSTGQPVATGMSDISLQALPAGTYMVRTPSGVVLNVLR